METQAGEVTLLLRAWSKGDPAAESRLFDLVLPDLAKVAQCLMRSEPHGHSAQPNELLNEAYCRLVDSREREWQSRHDFFAIAGRSMRRLIIDQARGQRKGQTVAIGGLEEWLRYSAPKLEQAVALDAALHKIEGTHPDWCSIVELKFFMNLSDEETASALGLPLRTLQRKFGDARRFLYEEQERDHGAG